MPTSYDGVIVGAGHHGLILGTYLAKLGLRIAIVERRLQYGGGLSTTEPGPPGFYQNPHSINHFNITESPWYRDLGLSESVRYVTPQYEFAQPHLDGTSLVISRDVEETIASIARFSNKDAETFREWNLRAERISDAIFLAERYSEPLPEKERDALLSQSALGRDFLEIIERQPLELVKDLFEHEKVQLLMLFKLSLFGTVLYDAVTKRSPMGAAVRGFDLSAGYQVCVGGSWNLARGLMEEFIRSGGHFVNKAEVERIIVDGGRATGVQLADGTTVGAGQFVASCVDVPQTWNKLVGREQLPAEFLRKVDGFKHTAWGLFGVHLALTEAPRYVGSEFNPNINHALKYNIGAETMEELFTLHQQVAEGRVPDLVSFGSGSITQFDPSQAPKGGSTAYAWYAVPYAPGGDPENIEPLKAEITQKIIAKWREYAPNLTDDTIVDAWCYTPNDYTKEIVNMVDGDIFVGSLAGDQTMWNHFGYRTPIPNLYMAGSATHPGGGISGGASYIVSGIIAEDLGLMPWWTPVEVRKAMEAAQ
ncbi:NAD(P)/FAD-dependent oxidoreductase [Pseudonocardia halophobica]|uniref:FAD-dependent oxidoreductase n=1 Tax=Pseudonocardia halophobica TaxID=29401 RepID=A0A9W6L7F2_9PSEU|nr:NAD(P)/FAD-dependent oxidoreductase [Pseudonocardia halophobica]GLL14493.1 FAD-dependent oxidoreductase [Pseudonocardia halophobica]